MCPLTQRKGVFFLGGGILSLGFYIYSPQLNSIACAFDCSTQTRERETRERERERQRPTFFDGERSKTREDRRPKNATTTTTPPPFAGYIKRGTLFKRSAEDFGRRRFDCRSAD